MKLKEGGGFFYQQAWHRNAETALLQAKEGLVDEVVIDGLRAVGRRMAATGNALYYEWPLRKQTMNPEYQEFVDELLGELSETS